MLDAFWFHDPRVTLVPIEQPRARRAASRRSPSHRSRSGRLVRRVADLLDEGFALYWERLDALARRPATGPPRLRNVAVVHDATPSDRTSLLNTSTWMLYASDLDPEASDPELVAYLLAHGNG